MRLLLQEAHKVTEPILVSRIVQLTTHEFQIIQDILIRYALFSKTGTQSSRTRTIEELGKGAIRLSVDSSNLRSTD